MFTSAICDARSMSTAARPSSRAFAAPGSCPMRVPETFRSSAFRAPLAFALATTVAIIVIFGFDYLQIKTADGKRVRAILVDEASKGADYSQAEMERALEL